MPVPRRSTEPERPRHHRELTYAPDTLVDFHTAEYNANKKAAAKADSAAPAAEAVPSKKRKKSEDGGEKRKKKKSKKKDRDTA